VSKCLYTFTGSVHGQRKRFLTERIERKAAKAIFGGMRAFQEGNAFSRYVIQAIFPPPAD
jgi:hypothetical protein